MQYLDLRMGESIFTVIENDSYSCDERDGNFALINPITCAPLDNNRDSIKIEDIL